MFEKYGFGRSVNGEVENKKIGGGDANIPRRHSSFCCFKRQCSTGCAGAEVQPANQYVLLLPSELAIRNLVKPRSFWIVAVGCLRYDSHHCCRFAMPKRCRTRIAAWCESDAASGSEPPTEQRGSGRSWESDAARAPWSVSNFPGVVLGGLPGAKPLRHRTAGSKIRRDGVPPLR